MKAKKFYKHSLTLRKIRLEVTGYVDDVSLLHAHH